MDGASIGSAGSRGQGCFWPLAGRPTSIRDSLYTLSVGNRYINSVWTPLTLEPCGPQVAGVRDRLAVAERELVAKDAELAAREVALAERDALLVQQAAELEQLRARLQALG